MNLPALRHSLGLLLMAASVLSPFSLAGAQSEPPNVILILADDLGWRDLGSYGSTFYETPNIDALAAEGMLYTDAYSASPACSPTRMSILTGRYPARTGYTSAAGHVSRTMLHEERHGGRSFQRGLGPSSLNYVEDSYNTIGEAMREAGYATSFFGKWHLGHAPSIPENHGFDHVKGGRWHSGPPGADRARQYFPPFDCETLQPEPSKDTHVDEHLTDLAIEYMRAHKEKPFFMCFWPYSVHAPFQSKPELIEEWKGRADTDNPQHSPTMAAMIEVLDDCVGRLLDGLEAEGLADNTIIIFSSDNGGNMYNEVDGTTPTNNAPLRGGKVNTLEGGIRVPLIVRWPDVTQAGARSDAVVSTTDFYPTVLEIAGQALRPEDHLDGESFAADLRGKPFDRSPLIFDQPHFATFVGNIPNSAVRYGDWKFYRYWYDAPDQTHREELYYLGEDIGEIRDVAAERPELVDRFGDVLDRFFAQEDVLDYNPNKNYSGRRVGQWEALSDNGELRAGEDSFSFSSREKAFTIETPFASRLPTGRLEFEARSPERSPLRVRWSSNPKGRYSDKHQEEVALGVDWERYSVRMTYGGMLQSLRLELPEAGGAEFRKIRLLTEDGTEVMNYLR